MKIINAIYFKDKWESPFYVSNTKSDKFKLSDGSTIDTDFMYQVEIFNLDHQGRGIGRINNKIIKQNNQIMQIYFN